MQNRKDSSLADMRRDYRRGSLEREELPENPRLLFDSWFRQAVEEGLPEPNAMILATADETGQPDARVVLLKGVDERGMMFYTNYGSAKARDLDANPRACLVFNWLEHQRQVRVRGAVRRLPKEESEAYFVSRPKGSQMGAWASRQSEVLESREELETRLQSLEAEFASAEALPMPDFWGGYVVAIEEIEFWQGRSSRLHDRFRFRQNPDASGAWIVERLSP